MPKLSHNSKTEPLICVKDVSVDYGDVRALEHVSFDLMKGQVAAIIGPNGSGKTTLVRAILGLLPLAEGQIEIMGESPKKSRKNVGYVPQKFNFDPDFPITVEEFMHLARHRKVPAHKVEEKIKEVGLVPTILRKRLGSLSGGQLQRVLVASAILDDPDLLVLDEPVTGIDIVGEATFYDAINHLKEEHDTTIILISHDLGVVSSFVDTVICINKKMMCAGSPQSTLTESNLQEVFGHHASFYGHQGHGTTTHRHHTKH